MGIQQLRQRLIDTARPFLQDDERPEIATIAFVGSMQVKSSVALAAASTLLTGGGLTMYRVPVKQYVLLTDRRLIVLPQNQITGRPVASVNAQLSRSALRVSETKSGLLTSSLTLCVDGVPGLKLRFPLPAKGDALAMAQALNSAVVS